MKTFLFSIFFAVSFLGNVSAWPQRKIVLFSETVLKRMYREHNAYVQEVRMLVTRKTNCEVCFDLGDPIIFNSIKSLCNQCEENLWQGLLVGS